MLVVIDQTGCPGFKLAKGSTPYVVLGMIIFKDHAEAEKAAKAVDELKKALNIKPEFKFEKTSSKIKEIFFEKICEYDFEVRVIIADKAGIEVPALRGDTILFCDYLIKTLFENNADLLLNASLKINKNINRKFLQTFSKYLHEPAGQAIVSKFKFCYSKNDLLIQLADMVVGAVSKYYAHESIFSQKLFDKLAAGNKIKSIWKLREASNTLP